MQTKLKTLYYGIPGQICDILNVDHYSVYSLDDSVETKTALKLMSCVNHRKEFRLSWLKTVEVPREPLA